MKKFNSSKNVQSFKLEYRHGRDTVRLFVNGDQVSRCSGGGYDMQGTCLADWMQEAFADKICKLDSRKFYGLFFPNKKTYKRQAFHSANTDFYMDGGCGISCIEKIGRAINLNIKFDHWASKGTTSSFYDATYYPDKRLKPNVEF